MALHFGRIRCTRRWDTQPVQRILARRGFRCPARPRAGCHKTRGLRELRQHRSRRVDWRLAGFVARGDRAAPGAWSAAPRCKAARPEKYQTKWLCPTRGADRRRAAAGSAVRPGFPNEPDAPAPRWARPVRQRVPPLGEKYEMNCGHLEHRGVPLSARRNYGTNSRRQRRSASRATAMRVPGAPRHENRSKTTTGT
jgi:hypothetical protein